MRWFGLPVLLVTLASCSGVEHRTVAEQEAAEFHQAYNDQSFASLYAAAAPGFREDRSEDEFVGLMRSVHRRLGPVQNARLKDWSWSYGRGTGVFTTATFETKFARGGATETFVFLTSRQEPLLVSYDISAAS